MARNPLTWCQQEEPYYEIKGDWIALRCKEYWSFMYLANTEDNLRMLRDLMKSRPNVTTSEKRTDYPTPSETNKKKKKEPDNGRRQQDRTT